jgi:transcriptional regulator with XRE-family HTH domain
MRLRDLVSQSPRIDLRQRRLMRRLSERTAARSIGISRNALVRAEAGVEVSPRTAKLISDFYGIPVESWHPKLRKGER